MTNRHSAEPLRAGTDSLSRRIFIFGAVLAPTALFTADLFALPNDPIDPKKLKPGQFAWDPERAPDGPVVVIVSIPDQVVTVYRNGIRIAVSTCSTGRPGHATPTGTFVILQKDVNHHSSLYDDAPMPFMERVTWGGVALHAGNLPGYPASHGCVRLPREFAKLLFGITHLGTTVIIGDRNSLPADVLYSGLLSQHTQDMAKKAVEEAKANAEKQATNPDGQAVSAVISTKEKRIVVFFNGVPAFEDSVTLKQPDLPFGNHVFSLIGPSDDPTKLKWMAVDLGADAFTDFGQDTAGAAQASALLFAAAIRRVDVPEATAHRLVGLLRPVVITDKTVDPNTYSAPGFTIMTTDDT
jgi:L,D-transpeptidase catalytic domain